MRRALIVLWPAFLAAALAEGMFFSLIDPHEALPGEVLATLSPLGVYTVGFLFFWAVCAIACMLTYFLATSPGPRQPPF